MFHHQIMWCHLELLLDLHLQNILVVVVILDKSDPVDVLLKYVFDELLRHLESGTGHECALEPSLFVLHLRLIDIQEERTDKRLEETSLFLQVAPNLLLLCVLGQNNPLMQSHFVSDATNRLILDNGNLLLRHESLVLLGESAIQVIFRD